MTASKTGKTSTRLSWSRKGQPVGFYLVLVFACLVLLAGLHGILTSLQAYQQERIREYEALADKLSQSAMTMLINEHYSNFQDLVDLLTGISTIQYIANYVGDEVGICAGNPKGLESALLKARAAEGSRIIKTPTGKYLVLTHLLPFNPDLFSAPNAVQMVFKLDPFFNMRNNLLIAVSLILLLVMLLGVATWMLQRTQNRLQEAENTKSQMITGLTHHAIKFLTVIQGQITKNEMRLQTGKKPDPGELQKDFRLASQNIESLNRLIENLNDHERLRKGGVKILAEWVPLEQKIIEAAASLEEMARRRGIRIEVAPFSGDLDIESDAHVVQQALINVLENAVIYTRAQTTVKVKAESNPDEIAILVEDQGPGIAKADQDRIFQAFIRLNPEVKGTGIGLYNARQLVRLVGGNLGVKESRVGQGTVFYIRFPRTLGPKEKRDA
ncbi:MAG: HAMP domain-containing sensor histidine kinase [candidate division FCPU426 bacterium]